jgi:hypothetical protein
MMTILNWSKAYPDEIFIEPDWKEVKSLLGDNLLTRVSASNMRHVVEGVGKIAKEALQ